MYKRIGIRNKRGEIIISPSPFNRTSRGFYLNVTETDIPAPDPKTAILFIEMQEYDRVHHREQVLKPVHCLGLHDTNYQSLSGKPELKKQLEFNREAPKIVPYDEVSNFHIENLWLTFGVEAEADDVIEPPKMENSTRWHAACLVADSERHADMWAKMSGDSYGAKLWAYICSELSNGSCQATGWTPDKEFIAAAIEFKGRYPLPETGNPAADAINWIAAWDTNEKE